jgi:hypothetical protein
MAHRKEKGQTQLKMIDDEGVIMEYSPIPDISVVCHLQTSSYIEPKIEVEVNDMFLSI